MARVYNGLRQLDPYHVTFGAIDGNAKDIWSFSDGTGALSLDVALVENYGISLAMCKWTMTAPPPPPPPPPPPVSFIPLSLCLT